MTMLDPAVSRVAADSAGAPPAAREPREPDTAALDRIVGTLAALKTEWTRVGLAARIDFLRRAIDGVLDVADAWVREACRHRDIDPQSSLAGEEWTAGPMTTIRGLRLLVEALEHRGRPRFPSKRKAANGQTVVKVFPRHTLDRFLYYNMTAEVWLEPDRPSTQGRIYRESAEADPDRARVSLVLGAGNVSSIGPLDVVHKLFVEDQVVLLKMNPVNAYLRPFLERAFAGLIEAGFLAIVEGGADVGAYLCGHPEVDTLHLTGSDRTYDAIVWGSDPEERRRRKAAADPVVDKPFTAELGCVTPVIVVPGDWTERQLDFQARHVAGMVAHNASFNCNAGKVLITASGWKQRDAFLSRLREALASIPPRRAYYPGAHERYEGFLERYPSAEAVGRKAEGVVPWTLIPDVPPAAGEFALQNEAFCGVLATLQLDADEPGVFLERAVEFVNEHVWGTLSCVLLIDPATRAEVPEALEDAIANLRYGSIGVNAWTGISFALGVTTWGAYPGHTREEIVSGVGVVHNGFLFDHPQKSVVRAPFVIWPKPVWFADHRNLRVLGRRLARFEAHHTPWDLAAVALAGLRG